MSSIFSDQRGPGEVLAIDSGSFVLSGSAQLRFRADASNDSDWVNIDDVTISAQ